MDAAEAEAEAALEEAVALAKSIVETATKMETNILVAIIGTKAGAAEPEVVTAEVETAMEVAQMGDPMAVRTRSGTGPTAVDAQGEIHPNRI
jgi:F0F1-type ATP synthase membrane subunit b/b'